MLKQYYIDEITGAISLQFVATQDEALAGLLPCNGASVLVATYPNLYQVLGDSFTDPVNTGTNFILPSLPLVMI